MSNLLKKKEKTTHDSDTVCADQHMVIMPLGDDADSCTDVETVEKRI